MAKHRFSRKTLGRRKQLVGLTAALAAAAGTTAVALSTSASGSAAGTSLSPSQADALTAARIDRRDLGSRDASRIDLSKDSVRKAADATLAQRRALSLSAAKQATAAKAAAEARAIAAAKAKTAALARANRQLRHNALVRANRELRAAAAAKAKAEAQAAVRARIVAKAAAAAAAAAPKIVLPTTGYHLTARFNQAGGRWAHNHTGLDFAAPQGTPVRSVMAGTVIQADWEGAYGRQVKVRHADGTVTSYSHMMEFDVSVGDSVQAGSMVGRIGMTGNTTGPHVHFEVLPGGGAPIDPEPWLRAHGLNP